MLITVIGRGHSGTRAMSHTLTGKRRVYGRKASTNRVTLIHAEDLYEACRVFSRHVAHLGGHHWDFSATHTPVPIDPAFTRLVETVL